MNFCHFRCLLKTWTESALISAGSVFQRPAGGLQSERERETLPFLFESLSASKFFCFSNNFLWSGSGILCVLLFLSVRSTVPKILKSGRPGPPGAPKSHMFVPRAQKYQYFYQKAKPKMKNEKLQTTQKNTKPIKQLKKKEARISDF